MRKYLLRLLWILLLAVLLYFAFRNAPLAEIRIALGQLRFWQIAILAGINAAIYALITLRWWFITRAEAAHVPYLPLLAVRVAVFGISYFTLGPQIGGEPLQVLALRHRYGLTYTRATATVLMDKLLEFLANFILLAFGLAAILESGIISLDGLDTLPGLLGFTFLLALPPFHIILLRRGIHPIAAILGIFPKTRLTRFLVAAERLAGAFCRRHLKALLAATAVSLIAALGMLSEYFLATSFLEMDLTPWQTIAAWTMSWLAFLVPLPGGLGALEASQVFTLGVFGITASSALSLALVIRARDLLIGGLGLLLASRGFTR
jgi:uncharacterized protein (TIRG00374 family)